MSALDQPSGLAGAADYLTRLDQKYDSGRHCSTLLGWNDPRGVDDDGEPLVDPVSHLPRDAQAERILYQERDGILMWPERFGPAEVVRIKAGLGPYTRRHCRGRNE